MRNELSRVFCLQIDARRHWEADFDAVLQPPNLIGIRKVRGAPLAGAPLAYYLMRARRLARASSALSMNTSSFFCWTDEDGAADALASFSSRPGTTFAR